MSDELLLDGFPSSGIPLSLPWLPRYANPAVAVGTTPGPGEYPLMSQGNLPGGKMTSLT